MSTLRTEVKYLDFIVDKKNTDKLYMVLHVEMHNVWVIKHGGGEAPFELPKRVINMTYMKCDPKVVEVLYSDRKDEQLTEPTPEAQGDVEVK